MKVKAILRIIHLFWKVFYIHIGVLLTGITLSLRFSQLLKVYSLVKRSVNWMPNPGVFGNIIFP